MSETLAPSIYETTFAKTEKTDAILVVQGKKLHVNKAILSYRSEYFDKLFNSDFKEKSMPEIEIKAVNFEHFAMLLSCVHGNTIKPYYYDAEKLLELSDRFLLPSVKPYLEGILIISSIGRFEKLRIAEKCDLKDLLDNGIKQFTKDDRSDHLQENRDYRKLSDNIILVRKNWCCGRIFSQVRPPYFMAKFFENTPENECYRNPPINNFAVFRFFIDFSRFPPIFRPDS